MRKLAGILAFSLVLELLSPMQAYAQPGEVSGETTAYEEITEVVETAEPESFSVMDSGENTSEENVTESEASTEASGEETSVEVVETEETDTTETAVEESVTEEPASEEQTVEETTELQTEEVTTESVTEEAVTEQETVEQQEDLASSDAVDISSQTELFLQEKYYAFEDKGYPLCGAVVLPASLFDSNFTISSIELSVDGKESKRLEISKAYCSMFPMEAEYRSFSFFAGYDESLTEGKHQMSYTITIYGKDGVSYSMELSGETEFVIDEGKERVYGNEWADDWVEYIPVKNGTNIWRILAIDIDYRTESEEITEVQLRDHETKEIMQTKYLGKSGEGYIGVKPDSRYKYIYDEKRGLWVGGSWPDEYYSKEHSVSIQLQQDIEIGIYDVVITTSEGYTHIKDSAYHATDQPVIYDAERTDSELKTSWKSNVPSVRVEADDSGKYVSVFVYGLNLTEANVPVFYDDSFTNILTEYDKADPYCHWEKHEYGIDITVKKKNASDPAWDVSDTEYAYQQMNVRVLNGHEGPVDTKYEYSAHMVYRKEYIGADHYGRIQGMRWYCSGEYVSAGDTVFVETTKYAYVDSLLQEVVDVSEAYVVQSNGHEYYIDIPITSGICNNSSAYIRNSRTGYKTHVYYNYMAKDEGEVWSDNIFVPANCKWEIHAAKDVGNVLCSGTTTEEANVLTPEQITELAKYGKLRVCIYDMDGNVVERYLTFLECSEYYTVEYVLNDTIEEPANLSENITYYFKDKGLTLETPVRENYTFGGWYSDSKLTKKVSRIAPGSTGNKILYAKWTPDAYSIIYHANGGKGKIKATAWKYKETASVAANTFTRTGYVFTGWNTKRDGSGTIYAEKQALSRINENGKKQITLYAVWEPVTYTLVLNKNNGNAEDGTINGSPAYIEMVYGEMITLTGDEYEWTGHTIKSWNTKPNGKGKKYSVGEIGNLTRNKDDVIMLYAQWAVEKYTITYDYKGGKVSSKNPASYTYESKDITLKEPKKAGYIFDGYYERDPETAVVSPREKVSAIKKGTTGDKKLYAKWVPVSYTVVLNKNSEQASYGTVRGENDAVKNCVYDQKNPYVLKGNEYVWNGKEITAWTTKPNGKGKKYKNGQELKNLTKNNEDSIVLYAQWSVKKYTIQYEGVDGIRHKNPTSYTYDESKKIKLKNVSRKGYIFGGWYAGSTLMESNRIEYIDRSIKQDRVIWAKWTPITYTVCLKPNASDASVKPEISQLFTVKYDETFRLNADSYVRDHYKIAYWSKNSKGSGTKYQSGTVSNLTTKDGSLITLYPKWELEKYPVVYENTDFENVKNKNPETYTYNKEVKLKNPTRTGYVFGGWYRVDTTTAYFDPQTAEKIVKIPKGSEGTVKLYAYWKPLTYYVQILSNAKDAQNGSVEIGSDVEKQQITAGEALVFAEDTYVRDGYILTGFSEKKNGKGKCYGLGSEQYVYAKREGSTVKLYAVWEKAAPKKVKDVVLTVNGSNLIVSFTPNEGRGYYEIEYSDTISMRNADRIVLEDKESSSVTIRSLTYGKRYYVRVREVQVDSCKNKIYGSWSRTVNIVK